MENSNIDIALNFRAYLDKLGCTFRSMEEYDRMLRTSFNKYLSEYPNYNNFYDCNDSSLFSKIFDRMNADPYYKDLNKKWRSVPENAFRHYLSFLYVSKRFNWQENPTIRFYRFLTEEKSLSVTNAGKIVDILKKRNEAKSVLNSYNIEDTESILAIVRRVVDDIIKSYDGINKDIAIQGSKYLLEFGIKTLPKRKIEQKQHAKIEMIQKEIKGLLIEKGLRSVSFSIVVDKKGFVSFA